MNAEKRVWDYVLSNRATADARSISLNCDVTETYAQGMLDRISSENWRDEVTAPKSAVKHDETKARYDLIPPEIEEAIAQVLTFGASKYGDRNWELGTDWGRVYAAQRRHMAAWWSGEDKDPETGMSHTWHAAGCIAFLVAYEARGAGNDDRSKVQGGGQ